MSVGFADPIRYTQGDAMSNANSVIGWADPAGGDNIAVDDYYLGSTLMRDVYVQNDQGLTDQTVVVSLFFFNLTHILH